MAELAFVNDAYLSAVFIGYPGQGEKHHERHQMREHQNTNTYINTIVRISVLLEGLGHVCLAGNPWISDLVNLDGMIS